MTTKRRILRRPAKKVEVKKEEVILDNDFLDDDYVVDEELDELEELEEELEEEEELDEEYDDEDEEDEIIEEDLKKTPSKKEKVSKKKKSLFGATKSDEIKLPKKGGTITRGSLNSLVAKELNIRVADAEEFIRGFEKVMEEQILPNYSVNIFGGRFKYNIVKERLYKGAGGLEHIKIDTETLVPEHVRNTCTLYFGRKKIKRKMTTKKKKK